MVMAGADRHDAARVDEIATRIYTFVANGEISPSPAEGGETSENPDEPVKRGPGRPRKS